MDAEQILELELDEEALLFEPRDSLDAALVGVGCRVGQLRLAVYDYELLIEAHQSMNDWSREDATEWVDFNTVGAWVGEGTPIILYRPFEYV